MFSQRLLGLALVGIVGILLFTAGCKQESPSDPPPANSSGFRDVTLHVEGMT